MEQVNSRSDLLPKEREPDFNIPKGTTVKAILTFLDKSLPEFSALIKSIKSPPVLEDDLNSELIGFLQDSSNELLFHFNAKRGADININVRPYRPGARTVFLIETKRLPPTNNKDYVKGNTGGIERFKRRLPGYGSHLTASAMVAYIQKFNVNYWHESINRWIQEQIATDTDLEWDECDKLTGNAGESDFVSTHSRNPEPPITLFHFWLLISKGLP